MNDYSFYFPMLRGEKQITTQLNKKRVNDKIKT